MVECMVVLPLIAVCECGGYVDGTRLIAQMHALAGVWGGSSATFPAAVHAQQRPADQRTVEPRDGSVIAVSREPEELGRRTG
jgi:hypothetical protein